MDIQQLRNEISALENEIKLCMHNYNFSVAIKDEMEMKEYLVKIKSLNMELKLFKQTLLQRLKER